MLHVRCDCSAECAVQRMLCGICYAVLAVFYVHVHCRLCTMQCAFWVVYYAVCTKQRVLCSLYYVVCTMQCVLCCVGCTEYHGVLGKHDIVHRSQSCRHGHFSRPCTGLSMKNAYQSNIMYYCTNLVHQFS